jgi:anti-sigma factor RsiW
MNTDHAWAEEHIAAYLAGELTAEDRDRLDAHLDACDSCARQVQEAANKK